jgi:hypothetical protein
MSSTTGGGGTTNKTFVVEHEKGIKQILRSHKVKQCLVGHFTSTGCHMMIDALSPKVFHKVQQDLMKYTISQGVASTLTFSAFDACGQSMPIPSDAMWLVIAPSHSTSLETTNGSTTRIVSETKSDTFDFEIECETFDF